MSASDTAGPALGRFPEGFVWGAATAAAQDKATLQNTREDRDGFGLIEQIAWDRFLPRAHDLIEHARCLGGLFCGPARFLRATLATCLCRGVSEHAQHHRNAEREEKAARDNFVHS